MSKIIKGVKKVFQKIVPVIKKVAPYALAIGAIVFTAGAALGATGILGMGWGGAAAALGGAAGGGTIGGVIAGAMTQAGWGALSGGLISKAQGGSFLKGAQAGALTGAVTGGVMGGLNPQAALSKGPVKSTPSQQGPATPSTIPEAPVANDGLSFVNTDKFQPRTLAQTAGMGPPSVAGTVSSLAEQTVSPNTSGGFFKNLFKEGGVFGKGGFVDKHDAMIGSAVRGLASGLGGGEGEGEGGSSRSDDIRTQFEETRSNYSGTDPSRNYRGLAPVEGGESPKERFDPDRYVSYDFQYDPSVGRVVRVPRTVQFA